MWYFLIYFFVTAERSSVGDFRRYFDKPNHQDKLPLYIFIHHRYCMLKLYIKCSQKKHMVSVGISSCLGLKYLLLAPETQLENVSLKIHSFVRISKWSLTIVCCSAGLLRISVFAQPGRLLLLMMILVYQNRFFFACKSHCAPNVCFMFLLM